MSSYTKDFKQDALRYIEDHPDMKIKDIADYLGVPVGTLYDWNRISNAVVVFDVNPHDIGITL